MYMFLEWIKVHLGSSTLSIFDFIDWLDYKWGEGVVFLCIPPFFGLVYIVYTLGTFQALLIQLLLPVKKKNVFIKSTDKKI